MSSDIFPKQYIRFEVDIYHDLVVCVWQEGAGNVLFHGEDAGQHAGRLWDENGEGGPGATKQA